jgi:hypothetical protein
MTHCPPSPRQEMVSAASDGPGWSGNGDAASIRITNRPADAGIGSAEIPKSRLFSADLEHFLCTRRNFAHDQLILFFRLSARILQNRAPCSMASSSA